MNFTHKFKIWRTDVKKSRVTQVNKVETHFFRDNERTIDYVIAYTDDDDEETLLRRRTYEQNLVNKGLQLEKEDKSVSVQGLGFKDMGRHSRRVT